MVWNLDARIPLTVVTSAGELAARLAAGPPAAVLGGQGGVAQAAYAIASPHQPGCSCCAGRSAAALALDLLFQARVRGQVPWFDRVLALAEDAAARDAVAQALQSDALTAARYRPG